MPRCGKGQEARQRCHHRLPHRPHNPVRSQSLVSPPPSVLCALFHCCQWSTIPECLLDCLPRNQLLWAVLVPQQHPLVDVNPLVNILPLRWHLVHCWLLLPWVDQPCSAGFLAPKVRDRPCLHVFPGLSRHVCNIFHSHTLDGFQQWRRAFSFILCQYTLEQAFAVVTFRQSLRYLHQEAGLLLLYWVGGRFLWFDHRGYTANLRLDKQHSCQAALLRYKANLLERIAGGTPQAL